MTERILASKSFVAYLLASATGLTLYFRCPFPGDDLLLRLIALRQPLIFEGFKVSYDVFLFTTPYILYSAVFSGLYIFALRPKRKGKPLPLPPYPDPRTRKELFLVLGEVHDPRSPVPGEHPYWLKIPERGLRTGIAILGAIGASKTTACMYPYTEQLIAFKADDPAKRIGGLVLEVKGDFCHKVRRLLERYGRGEDYVEVNLRAERRYNPLYNDLDAYALAYNIASLLNNLFGKGKEPFWQQAYTNLVKFIILLHKTAYGYVTLFDLYECAINQELLEQRIHEAEELVQGRRYFAVPTAAFRSHPDLERFDFKADEKGDVYKAPQSKALEEVLRAMKADYECQVESGPGFADPFKQETLEAVKRWFYYDWRRIDNKLRTSIVEGISVFLSLFDDNPWVKRTFCPPKECYDPKLNADGRYGRPLAPFEELIEQGKVCALNFPVAMNSGLAKAIGCMMKLDFQRAVLNRIPKMEAEPGRYWRQVFFICDEYHEFATAGQNDPNGDEKFLALSREPKCIPIIATQSISSLHSALPGETWRTVLQSFRTKIFLTQTDEFSAKSASELCGREDQWKVNYNISESGHDARVSLWTGKAIAHKANVTTSKSYNTQSDYRFDLKTFMELKNAQAVTLAYDGFNPMPPMLMYLKPYFNDVNKSYFKQLADGELDGDLEEKRDFADGARK
jgi:hypothetical protein